MNQFDRNRLPESHYLALKSSKCYHVSGKDAKGQPVKVQVFAKIEEAAYFYAKNIRPDCTFDNAQIQIP